MPAVRERIYICPDQSGQPCQIVEFPLWWNRSDFFRKYGQRQIDTGHPIYVNYGLLLTGVEAIVWDESCREQFAQDPRSKLPVIVEAKQRVQSLLEASRWVIIESSEWESGLS